MQLIVPLGSYVVPFDMLEEATKALSSPPPVPQPCFKLEPLAIVATASAAAIATTRLATELPVVYACRRLVVDILHFSSCYLQQSLLLLALLGRGVLTLSLLLLLDVVITCSTWQF